ncbi:hypothetical protein TVAG_055910 [Trichomonas vaginalis G3]|uniref:Uncharacterized protein n=1 Tax=Trichomonas vaginalis (strain ATCC PRA-98 / G3) TaxID=412133 RepID=A2EL44_TRIV3|nr:hypothetical protein TVAGG3_0217080 [Trichomonas vaginalis G3]XP_051111836.1 hypothetical protein TVAGG3_0217060 [Trichomonas vaginalis G3]EAX77264.1 hypothetical protein TVAG_504560 [Trichomonas vaginalis G3]EAY06597.1 hypothetical protein TVAG_055910 [Trichomonas vaginalis G3]KAI5551634.1 hypothetical protein TVAGG3_0217060 [Trichomonas vaginalis G3]KAI5551636.1 hypothetical protein TVAGG3_0217080 [Trichomonas vaginalis G3]|eukprot:XP_001290194.1 hypothetical protein [Trichomonas vaginalis G3]
MTLTACCKVLQEEKFVEETTISSLSSSISSSPKSTLPTSEKYLDQLLKTKNACNADIDSLYNETFFTYKLTIEINIPGIVISER